MSDDNRERADRDYAPCFVNSHGVKMWFAGLPAGVMTINYGGVILTRLVERDAG